MDAQTNTTYLGGDRKRRGPGIETVREGGHLGVTVMGLLIHKRGQEKRFTDPV